MKASRPYADYETALGCIALLSSAIAILEMTGVVPEETWGYAWPLMLGLLGLYMIFLGTSDSGMACGCEGECGCAGANCKMETGSMPMSMPMPVKTMKKPVAKPVKKMVAQVAKKKTARR